MDMEGALRARLLGQTGAGQRVTWLTRPQASALPAITLQAAGGDVLQTFDGIQSWQEERVQLDAWAATYDQAKSIRDAAIPLLAPRQVGNGIRFDRMSFEHKRSDTEQLGSTTIYRAGVDLIVRYSLA